MQIGSSSEEIIGGDSKAAGSNLRWRARGTRLASARTTLYTVSAEVLGLAASGLPRIVSSKLPKAPSASTCVHVLGGGGVGE
jgi:hypothetical protein